MKVKATAKELKNADVRFISLVKRGANRIPFRILKTDKGENQMIDLASLSPVLKGDKIEAPAKKAYSPNFAQILGASVARDIGTPPLKIAPAKPVQSIAGTNPESTHAQASGGKPTRQAFNTPKEPLRAERGNVVEFKDLQAAINSALSKQRDEEKARAFNESRSAFARLAPTKKSDVQGGGSGNAWGLRNLGGKLASAVLNSTTRKDESALPTNTGFRAVSGVSLKG
ncbi:MAG: hypothetical protein NDI95_02050 [Acidovorax soli]|uniref:hypothetical protein n=1 Tax=Acidovorax soli TaxID=592050 RepID=UPI0026F1E00D|nr:hypothetical protein [Acidovorax soli]MCM2345422.1 hypothetical protein [Acidovorax soli]